MNEEKNNWELTTNKRYVAYIDIMGFKDMISRTSHNEIYQMMKNIEQSKKRVENLSRTDEDHKLVRTTMYSDSIMIYSMDEGYNSLKAFIFTVSHFNNDLLLQGVPHKGAIAFGEMTIDFKNSIFFGQPLIDAYLLQKEFYLYGIICHATAEIEIDKHINNNKTIILTKNYLCPFKNGVSKHLTICPLYAKIPLLINSFDILFDSVKKLRYKTSGNIRKYIDNTELYLNDIRKI